MLRSFARRLLLAVTAVLLPTPALADPATELAAIEVKTGGRLGVALVNGQGALLLGHRTDERFALCSTFKLPLAAMVLDRFQRGGPSLHQPIVVQRSDLVPYAPFVEGLLGDSDAASTDIGEAAEAIVQISDNTAANLLLTIYGGPPGFTDWLRDQGDMVTRLDRIEPKLNENAPGDPRDTTNPAAIARTTQRLALGDRLAEPLRAQLLSWMEGSKTGAARIRAGLPAEWRVGDKTGTCGTAYNDVAVFFDGKGQGYTLAVYLDRPTVEDNAANAAIAEVARLAAQVVTQP